MKKLLHAIRRRLKKDPDIFAATEGGIFVLPEPQKFPYKMPAGLTPEQMVKLGLSMGMWQGEKNGKN